MLVLRSLLLLYWIVSTLCISHASFFLSVALHFVCLPAVPRPSYLRLPYQYVLFQPNHKQKAWPRPNPANNPVTVPPKQSPFQQELFANHSKAAAAASAAAVPELTSIIEYCSEHAVDHAGRPYPMFNATNCPGMADLTNNGTTASSPSAAQILKRFSEEVCSLVRLFVCLLACWLVRLLVRRFVGCFVLLS